MLFKDTSIFSSGRHFIEHVQFWLSALQGIFLRFGSVVQEEVLFKDISYLELWWPFCSAEWNHLCNFGKRQIGEHSWKII